MDQSDAGCADRCVSRSSYLVEAVRPPVVAAGELDHGPRVPEVPPGAEVGVAHVLLPLVVLSGEADVLRQAHLEGYTLSHSGPAPPSGAPGGLHIVTLSHAQVSPMFSDRRTASTRLCPPRSLYRSYARRPATCAYHSAASQLEGTPNLPGAHLCHTGVTLVSHLCYTGVSLAYHIAASQLEGKPNLPGAHLCHTGVTLASHWRHTCVTPVLHWCVTGVPQRRLAARGHAEPAGGASHCRHTGVALASHCRHTGVALVSHLCLTGVALVSHLCHTGVALAPRRRRTCVTLVVHSSCANCRWHIAASF
eukprot:1194611-Prorocentrum_minimum.AAC.16